MSTHTPADAVLAVLRRSTFTTTSVILPNEQLDRELYVAVDKVLKGYGGKWNRSARAHVFTSDPRAKLAAVLEGEKAVNEQQAFGAFYTPSDVALQVAKMALSHLPARMELERGRVRGLRFLEPSAGDGALIRAAREVAPAVAAWAVEIREECRPALVPIAECVRTTDFLNMEPDPERPSFYDFDAVIMNPPFAHGADVAHVAHALKFLRPGGRLAAIMSPGWTFKKDRASSAFRALIKRESNDCARWSPLPAGTFKESGTDVATGVLYVQSPA